MLPRTRKKHPPDIFAKPRLPFQERTGPSSSEGQQVFPYQQGHGNSEEISGRKALSRAEKRERRDRGEEGPCWPPPPELEPASRSRPGNGKGNGNGTTMTRTTTTCLPCSTPSAFNPTSNTPVSSNPKSKYGGAEPTSITPTTSTTTASAITHYDPDKYGDDGQFPPKCSSNCYIHKSSAQRVQLLSDSEISVLDLGPSLRVSGASCTPDADDMVQKNSMSSSESEILLRDAVPITSTTSPRSTSVNKEHAYGHDIRKTSTFKEQRNGECGHCGNSSGYKDEAKRGYGSSASGNTLAPETGDARMRRCKIDGAGDHECDCDYQCEYDVYGYGYGGDGGDRHDEFTPIVSATTTVSSPILSPLKTTREEPPGAERTQLRPRRAHFASDFD